MSGAAHEATTAQIRAAAPQSSTWVSANAGSGKTRVLTDRVARLLLRGTLPDRILCLTYTKAAAAEMQNRLFKRLGTWAMMPEADLRETLKTLGEHGLGIEADDLARARTLFARALETPGGLKIQTIHAFCDRLLRRFPLEAGVSPQFEVLEDRQAAQLRRSVLDDMAERDTEFADYAPWLARLDGDRVLAEILSNRQTFARNLDEAEAMARLGLSARKEAGAHLAAVIAAASGRFGDLIEIWASTGGKVEKTAADNVADLGLQSPDAALARLSKALFKADGDPRAHNFPTAAVKKAMPDAPDIICAMQGALALANDQIRAEALLDQTIALHAFARRFLQRYSDRKQALGRLDFDDLIDKAQTLLRDSAAAAWVQYRMDGGIDHVLVDEAQDTSPAQWQVISALTDDFFAGLSARDVPRTVFVVGDEKQSIYSFQGADPLAFGEMKGRYAATLDAAAEGLESCDLLYSFRSAPPILQVVDRVFAGSDAHGLGEAVHHRAFHDEKPGRVDLWPFITKPEDEEDPPWYLPLDLPSPDDPAEQLGAKIAAWAGELLASGYVLPGTDPPRPVQPGDIMILVRSRGTVFKAVLAALKRAGLPVAGADRLKLGEDLGVRDLLSLLRFLATEEDDLALAEILRSPLGGLSEGALFTLAHGRDGALWDALSASGAHEALVARLRRLRNRADFLRPFELLQLMLTTFGGRKALIARLGAEAKDGIDALIDLALDYERVAAPTILGFLDWISASEAEVKRQMDADRNEIRLMTVHGAKGLEAPIVILPETGDPRLTSKRPALLKTEDRVYPASSREERPKALKAAEEARQQRALEEHWRLLYVALTRAETWLVVCGAGSLAGRPDVEWYSAVKAAMSELSSPDAEGGMSLTHDWSDAVLEAPSRAPSKVQLPDWASHPGPRSPALVEPILPSRDGGAGHGLAGMPEDGAEEGRLRGIWIHALLEADPLDLSDEAARRLLARTDPPAPPEMVSGLLAEAQKTRAAPELAWIWGANALAEVPVAGRVAALGPRPCADELTVWVWATRFGPSTSSPTPVSRRGRTRCRVG